jgi:heptose I phosphotransferase
MNATIYLEEPLRTLWAEQDAFAAAAALEGAVLRALEGRRTLRTDIAGRGYYLKIHRGVGWWEIFKNLLSGRLPILGAGNEWRALQRLRALGVETMRPVAYGERGSNPATRHSFILTEELAPTISLEDYCRHWQGEHAVPPQVPALGSMVAPTFKRALICRVATMARRMHRGGVNHRDFYLCHFLLHLPLDLQAPKLSLIDLHRAQVRPHTPRRWRDKDLAALYFSALDIGLTQRDRLRFLRTYFGRPLREILATEATLLSHLDSEARRLMARYQRKFAPEAGQ